MGIIETSLPTQIFTPSLSESVLHLTRREQEEQLTLDEKSAIEYLSGVMADFVPVGRFFKPDELYINLFSLTEQWLTRQDDRHPSRRVADFLLIMRGMFPEKLERQKVTEFYEKVGAGLYWRLYRTERGFFRRRDGMLAENFTSYGEAIRHSRDTYFDVKRKDDWAKIVPYSASLTNVGSPRTNFH